MEIDRYVELASNVLAAQDIEKKHKGCCNLIAKIENELHPILGMHQDLIESNTPLRFSDFHRYFSLGCIREVIGLETDDYSVLLQVDSIGLYIALLNERAIIEEELELLGIDITPSKPHPTLPKKRETAEIMTERATFYFEKAIDKGWMRQNGNGYEWLYGESRGKVRLAYFLQKVYNPRGTEKLHLQKLEKLFGVVRLDSAMTNFMGNRKPQKWVKEIDSLFEKFPFKHSY